MANVKITQLPSATTPLTGTEVFPLVQGTTTKQVAITGLFTSPVMTNPTLGTVGQADLINATGLPISTGVAGLGTGIATFLGTPSSSNLRAAVTDETGTGSLVFATSPVLVTPNLGTPSVLVATNATGTAVGLTAGSAITNANLTGAVTSVGNATSLGSFTSAQLRTALTDETGAGSAVFATSPTITAPILNQINDTNNAQILGLSPTTSAVDYLVVKNGIGVGVPLHFYADGSSANIGLHIQPKGTGLVTISDGTDFNKGIRFRSSSSAASAVTLLDAVSTAGRVVTLPDATTTLVGRDTTDTLTNKTIAFSSNTFSGTLAIANGGTGQSTANAALNALLPAQTGNATKYLQTDGSNSSWDAISLSTADITGTLGTANGGTGLTSFTSGGVVYASSTSALATGSALTYDGSNFRVNSGTSWATSTGGVQLSMDGAGSDAYLTTYYDAHTLTLGAGVSLKNLIKISGSGASNNINFRVNNSDAMTLTSTGLGIGTSSPAQKLDVSGSGIISARITSTSSNATLILNSASGFYNYLQYTSAGSGGLILYDTTNSANRVVLDSAGNLGLGVTPSAWNAFVGSQIGPLGGMNLGGSVDDNFVGSNVYYNSGFKFARPTTATYATMYRQTNGVHSWQVSSATGTAGNPISFTQAMSLLATGELLIGKTAVSSSTAGLTLSNFSGNSGTVSCVKTVSGQATAWGNFHSGTYVGGIEYTNTATSFPTSSDVRMKKDIVDAPSASGKIDQIRIVSHGWKHDDSVVEFGVIAQELYSIAPQAITKGDDGEIIKKTWGVDYSKLVPMLIKEVQALRQRVATLEAQ